MLVVLSQTIELVQVEQLAEEEKQNIERVSLQVADLCRDILKKSCKIQKGRSQAVDKKLFTNLDAVVSQQKLLVPVALLYYEIKLMGKER